MAKKKRNKLIDYPIYLYDPNYYGWGGDFKEAFNKENMGNFLKEGAGALIGTAGNMIGGAISGGLSSGAGNIIGGVGNAIGDVASKINPLLGGVVKLGSGLLGGLTNKMFGSKLNLEKINEIESSNEAIASTTVGSDDNTSILGLWGSLNFGDNFTKRDIGKDGWFAHKASKKFRELQGELEEARLKALLSYDNAIDVVDTLNDLIAMANSAAFGGPINMRTDTPMSPFGNRFDKGGYSNIFPYGETLRNIYALENPYFKGIENGIAKMYDDRTLGAGIDVKTGFPELYKRAKKEGLPKQYVDELAITKLRHDDNVIRDNYADVYGKEAADTLSYGPRFLAALARYQQGNLRKGWKDIHKAMAAGDAEAIKLSILNVTPKDHKHRRDWIENFEVYKGMSKKQKEEIKKEDPGFFERLSNLFSNIFDEGGGLSRAKNYGSKKKPYPSVDSDDFAGGGRSYPIPTKADAIDALRLAGLHGRSDVKSKVYKKYPSLKHDLGGPLFTNGADWDSNLISIGNGGTHEENPNEGVQMGVDLQGVPNLVEQGELIWNDYVFSNRLKPTKEMKKKYKLKDGSFADAIKGLKKEWDERPNDPITNKTKEETLAKIAMMLEELRLNMQLNPEEKKYKYGGKKGNIFKGTGEEPNIMESPYIPPLGLEYFPSYDDDSYDFAKKNFHILNDDGTINFDKTYAPDSDFSKLRRFYIENWDNPNFKKYKDLYIKYVSKNNKDIDLSKMSLDDFKRITSDRKLGYAHDLNLDGVYNLYERMNTPLIKRGIPEFASLTEGTLDKLKRLEVTQGAPEKEKNQKEIANIPNSFLRYLTPLGPLAGLAMSLRRPDYSNANRIALSTRGLRDVKFNPIGNYMTYNPLDEAYMLNKLLANAAATRRAISENAGGNRGQAISGLLASDYNTLGALGDTYIKAKEYNDANRAKVAEFNRGTDMFNSEGLFKLDTANMRNDELRMNALLKAAAMGEEIKQGRRLSILGNVVNLFNDFGKIGSDNVNRLMLWNLGKSGALNMPKKASKGGRINRRNKGLTF